MTTRSQLSFTLKKHHLPLQVAGDKTYPQAYTGVKKVGNFVPFKSVFFMLSVSRRGRYRLSRRRRKQEFLSAPILT